MQSKQVFLHVGFPKTATTFLQEKLFSQMRGTYYWRKNSNCEYQDIIKSLYRSNISTEDFEDTRVKLEVFFSTITEDSILISDEALCGGVYDGIFLNFSTCESLALRCKRLFPNAKIIVSVRRQDKLLESLFRQALKEGYSQSIDRFLNYRNEDFGLFSDSAAVGMNIDVRSLDYLKYIEMYQSYFGDQNVCLVPQELLERDQSEFVKRICDFLGAEIEGELDQRKLHVSYSYAACKIAILFNRFFRFPGRSGGIIPAMPFQSIGRKGPGQLFRSLFKGVSYKSWLAFISKMTRSDKKFITPSMSQKIQNFYLDRNSKLARTVNIDLQSLGY